VRHVAVSPHQQRLRLAQSLANGGAVDYYLIGRLDNHEDRSGFEGIRELFRFHASHEDVYRNLSSKAATALLSGNYKNTGEHRGWFRCLVENHFLFDLLLAEPALGVSWDRYAALVIPDLEAISDALAARIDRFVEQGGTLIATGRAGSRDAEYERRPRPALECLPFAQLPAQTPGRGSYFKLDDKSAFRRFEATDLVYLDGPYFRAEYAGDCRRQLRWIPPHNFGPPERCYYELVSDEPGFVTQSFGKGRVVYVPWLPGQLFHRQGHVNTSDFMADLLEGAADLAPVGGTLPPTVEVTWFENPEREYDLLHLVNGSGHFGNSFFAPSPVRDAHVVLPRGRPADSVESLISGQRLGHSWHNGALRIDFGEIGVLDVVRIV
jgi:hypothetical protein